MGGSNLRVVEVLLRGDGVIEQGRQQKREIPLALMHAPASALFDFVASLLKETGCADGDTAGFTFSFPVAQTAVNAGRLIAWTKGFSNPGAVDVDVMGLFEDACHRQGVRPRLTALVNDTIGTLMSRAYSDTKCTVGVILGTGTNAAYGERRGCGRGHVGELHTCCSCCDCMRHGPLLSHDSPRLPVERTARIGKWHGEITEKMLINMEWGAFGSGTAFSLLPFHS
jgi:hexokinase